MIVIFFCNGCAQYIRFRISRFTIQLVHRNFSMLPAQNVHRLALHNCQQELPGSWALHVFYFIQMSGQRKKRVLNRVFRQMRVSKKLICHIPAEMLILLVNLRKFIFFFLRIQHG